MPAGGSLLAAAPEGAIGFWPDGSDAPGLTISGNDEFRVFFVGNTTKIVAATIENLTISHA